MKCAICGAPSKSEIIIRGKTMLACVECEETIVQFVRTIWGIGKRAKTVGSPFPVPSRPLSLESYPPHTHSPIPPEGNMRPRVYVPPREKQALLLTSQTSFSPDVHEVVDAWNAYFSLPRVEIIGKKSKIIKASLDTPFWRENWRGALKRLVKTKFCMGQNKKKWKADILWFCDPENIEKLLNGKYDGPSDKIDIPKDYGRDEI